MTTEQMVARNGGSVPVPDPTQLTDAAIARSERAMRDHIDGQLAIRDTKLAGIDEATRLRLSAIEAVPGQIAIAVLHRKEVADEQFSALQTQLRDRDVLFRRTEDLNALALAAAFNASKEAVNAALTAQKEAAAASNEANAKAIEKSERATAETIKTNQELSSTRLDSLTKSIDEVKLALSGVVNQKVGATEQRAGLNQNVALIAGVFAILAAFGGFIAAKGGL